MTLINNEAARSAYPFLHLIRVNHIAMYAAYIEACLFTGDRSIAMVEN